MSQEESKTSSVILIGIDNSENCEHAFDYYAKHIHKPDNEVILFHVSDQVQIPTYFAEGMIFAADDIRQKVEELRARNKQLEKKYDAKCTEQNMKHKFFLVTEDPNGPGHAIVEAAKKHNADLIVVGSRGLGAIKRVILGSTSTYVIHHGHIPALVCPRQ